MAIIMSGCCLGGDNSSAEEKKTIEIDNALTEAEISAGVFTPEIIWKMGRVGNSTLAPSGKQTAYTVTYYSVAENRGVTNIYLQETGGDEAKQLTDNAGNESNLQWNADGSRLYFLSDRGGDNQIWSVRPDGTELTQQSSIEGGIDGFGITNDESRLFYTQGVAVEKRRSVEIYTDMDKSKAKIYDDLMVRHWNYWDEGRYSHIFVAAFSGGKVEAAKDIMAGEPWDAPTATSFDIAEIAWNRAGTQLAYTCKKQTGTEYAVSTDSDIFIYDVENGTTRNICKDGAPVDPRRQDKPGAMGGYDRYPVWSPDDRQIAFTSMRRPGNEADKERLFVWNGNDGSLKDLTAAFDYNASNVRWNGNDELLFVAPMQATHQICRVNTAGGDVSVITRGDHDIRAFSFADGKVVAEVTQISRATELFDVDMQGGGKLTPLTRVNQAIFEHIPMGEVQKRWVATTDGRQMLTWVIFPPGFDPARKYPTLLYCQGGPQSVVSQSWSYRWNLQLIAAQGYIVVAPNRRGLPSFGQEWLDQISGDYSGQNIADYLSAIDDVAAEPWSDETRLGCVGASYGGYSAFFLAGNHNKRFKAFIAHCGIFNFESMYGGTEELWFVNNDYKGSYWDNDPVARRSYANSPHRFVARWDTPILIYAGINDFRIPYSQSLEAFTAARLRDIPARLVVFENEGHQVFKPQNSIVWNREFFGWLDKYLK
jgi:dipeptidyl aminopeptidase/acylaminoacyl peptidase